MICNLQEGPQTWLVKGISFLIIIGVSLLAELQVLAGFLKLITFVKIMLNNIIILLSFDPLSAALHSQLGCHEDRTTEEVCSCFRLKRNSFKNIFKLFSNNE